MASRKMVRLSSAFRCVQPFYTMQVWLHDEHELTLCGRSQSRPDKHLGWGKKGGGNETYRVYFGTHRLRE